MKNIPSECHPGVGSLVVGQSSGQAQVVLGTRNPYQPLNGVSGTFRSDPLARVQTRERRRRRHLDLSHGSHHRSSAHRWLTDTSSLEKPLNVLKLKNYILSHCFKIFCRSIIL